MRKLLRKSDAALILSILALSIGMLAAFARSNGEMHSPRLQIIVDNELTGTYALKEDQEIRIGETNTCEIRDGQVYMTSADCPDQICVKSRPIGAGGGSIVCLPNRIVLKIVDAEEGWRGENTESTGSSEEEVLDSIAG